MEYFSSLFLLHRACIVDLLEKLPILTVFHEDVELIVFSDNLINLSDVLVKQILLKFNFTLDGLQLVRVVLLECRYLHSHSLSCQLMSCFLHFTETALTDSLF